MRDSFWIGVSNVGWGFRERGALEVMEEKTVSCWSSVHLTPCEPWREKNLETWSHSADLMSIASDSQRKSCDDDDVLTRWLTCGRGGRGRPGSVCCSFPTMTMERQTSHRHASCSADHALHALANRKCAKVTPKTCLKVRQKITKSLQLIFLS